jgi:hypothetical protein
MHKYIHIHTHTHNIYIYIYIYIARIKCIFSHLKADVRVHSFFKIRPSFLAVLFKVLLPPFDTKGGRKGIMGEYKKEIVFSILRNFNKTPHSLRSNAGLKLICEYFTTVCQTALPWPGSCYPLKYKTRYIKEAIVVDA